MMVEEAEARLEGDALGDEKLDPTIRKIGFF
jgi:hypothetical protein